MGHGVAAPEHEIMGTRVAVMHHKGIVTEGIVSLIGRTRGFEVVERIQTIKGFKDGPQMPEIGVLVLGVGEPGSGLDGAAVATRLRRSRPGLSIVAVFEREAGPLAAMTRHQVDGYIMEDAPLDLLPVALRTVRDGRMFVCKGLQPRVQALLSAGGNGDGVRSLFGLSEHRTSILRLLVGGDTYGEFAAKLGLETSTIASHVLTLRRRLGLSSRTALIKFAMQHGFH